MRVRLVTVLILASTSATLLLAPPTFGASAGCQVRNVTRGTAGSSFVAMVKAARDGDRLRVRGRCEGGVRITADLTIIGVGDPRPTLTGRDRHRVLTVWRGVALTLRHLDLAHGVYRGWAWGGGGILNLGTLTLADSVVRESRSTDEGSGGGIMNGGAMTLVDSVVRDNVASSDGGGIHSKGTVELIRTVVRDNQAGLVGGGIANAYGTTTLSGSVVHGNRARGGGGGIQNEGALLLTGTSVRDNRTKNDGGGILNGRREMEDSGGDVHLMEGSSITGNSAGAAGGGIWNNVIDADSTVTLGPDSTVTGNSPDDCVGTPAC